MREAIGSVLVLISMGFSTGCAAQIPQLRDSAEQVAPGADVPGLESESPEPAAAAGMEFVRIPAGEFLMGSNSPDAEASEQPVTRVLISRAFDLGKYEVTQGQWEAVMGSNPSRFDACGSDCPVETVSWEDAREFIRRLNAMDGEGTYRLPTEAEWEYSARAVTAGDRDAADLDAIAWCGEISADRTHPVGGKTPNAFGLHDMIGNVYEWVEDRYGPYPGEAVTDPEGAGSGSMRVFRGGCWYYSVRNCRSSYRGYDVAGGQHGFLGFRVLRTVS